MKSRAAAAFALAMCGVQLVAQTSNVTPSVADIDFEVVSIKLNTNGLGGGGGIRTLPDGTMMMVNQPIRSIIRGAALEPTREVLGLPDWAVNERYDITTKPPEGSTRDQRSVMMQRMFAQRFNARVHVEQRDRSGFALVLARRDGRLGPNIGPAKENCLAPGPRPDGPPTAQDAATRCGGSFGIGFVVSGGMRLGSLTPSLEGVVGGPITDRTGLSDFYSFELRYSQSLASAGGAAPEPADAPDIFTALQEQLGLKLERETLQIPVLVIDHLERPTEN